MNREERSVRRRVIRDVLERSRVESQEELLELLEKRGYRITQATLSRELKSLSAGKVPDDAGGYRYALRNRLAETPDAEVDRMVARGFLWMGFSGSNGLIKTLPGFASSIASALDGLGLGEILGTIAGDDTILVVPRDGVPRADLVRALVNRVPELGGKLE